jgi:hypothetical protein
MKDLILLVPDKNTESGIEALINRFDSLHIRSVTYDIFRHPQRDPGIWKRADQFLRALSNQYSFSLILFDYEGSGVINKSVEEMINSLKTRLEINGWPNRSEVIIFKPEVEIWIWVDSIHTSSSLGWNSYQKLKEWLIEQNLWDTNAPKPSRPKEAMESALLYKRIPRSSSLYAEIARNVNLQSCHDPTFDRFKQVLQKWFPYK